MNKLSNLFSKRTLIAGVLAGSAVLAASTFAMTGGPGGQGPAENCAQRQALQDKGAMQARFQEMRSQRLATLKDKLQLQPHQEGAWQTFANGLPGKGPGSREERQAMRDSIRDMPTPQRMDMMLARADQRRAQMVQRAEAVKQFYTQLSPEQQKVFDAEAMIFRNGHRHHGARFQQS
ncbi:MAG: Spy/CpxP family protein refolding chaperone [Thiobacillus sp.]|nr:Spy/CpxP family protein refolding chaperone [Thiobacillus sp.]